MAEEIQTKTIRSEEKRWYAVYTKSRNEKKLAQLLDEKGIECYLPLIKTIRQWSDRRKKVELPLIRSYVFVHISNDREYLRVLETDGAVRFITFSGRAVAIPDKQIEDLKLLVASDKELEVTRETLEKGDKIEIKAGTLMGLQGELVEHRGTKKMLVRIDHIGQSILVEVPVSYLIKKQTVKAWEA
ncbi:MAG: UpxY family transcription antiterminator [Bacteroidales bacterium]|nr:UpxY family transcription antiterminator [Bacteroidales bacterium]